MIDGTMSADDFAKLWHLLNAATGEVIDARRAERPETVKARLRQALVETRKAEREILRVLESAE